nr:ubiquitin-like protein pmt3/smt3 [Quercus suber]
MALDNSRLSPDHRFACRIGRSIHIMHRSVTRSSSTAVDRGLRVEGCWPYLLLAFLLVEVVILYTTCDWHKWHAPYDVRLIQGFTCLESRRLVDDRAGQSSGRVPGPGGNGQHQNYSRSTPTRGQAYEATQSYIRRLIEPQARGIANPSAASTTISTCGITVPDQSNVFIMSEQPSQSPGGEKPEEPQPQTEHLNIKVTDNNNEVFFKIKRTTQLKKLMDAFCERQGKTPSSCRFLFDGTRVNPTDNPDSLDMQDGDTLEVHQEQIGGVLLVCPYCGYGRDQTEYQARLYNVPDSIICFSLRLETESHIPVHRQPTHRAHGEHSQPASTS